MSKKPKGSLIIIGGGEAKESGKVILEEVARRAEKRNGRLALVTVATQQPEEVAEEYTKVFKELGVRTVDVVDIRAREEAFLDLNVEKIVKSSVVFFTGGDQLRITSQIGDSPVFRCMRDIHERGGTIAGTSAGAAAMSETMLVGGPSDQSNEISALAMAPGLGFMSDMVIDSHFAQRGRIGRLLGAVSQNPRNLGVGIDEDTAIIVDHAESFRVIGSGAVYVLDGANVSYSSLSEEYPEGILSIFDVKLHVLGEDDIFDLSSRRPCSPEQPKVLTA
ncbi:MAG TPA: cyanophycinase [Chloroflexia bacterium]|nr:cyanophycinase [Chloroflexia bacterium]